MRVNVLPPPPIFCWLLLVLLGGALRSQAQATYQVPLGSAAAYGLLSKGDLTAQDAVPGAAAVDISIRVLGKAGASQGIGSLVAGTAGSYAQGSGDVGPALDDLQKAKDYCSTFYSAGTSQIASQLDGQTLTGGVYNIGGDAVLGSDGPLTISGDTSTVVIREYYRQPGGESQQPRGTRWGSALARVLERGRQPARGRQRSLMGSGTSE